MAIAYLFAVFSAVLQWSVPYGWMLSSNDRGYVTLVPCPSSYGALTLGGASSEATDHEDYASHDPSANGGMDHSDHHDGSGDGQSGCDFASLNAPFLSPAAAELSAPPISGSADVAAQFEAFPGRGLAAPPPPATGPPILIV
ncbi:hypothetical protein [Aurantiacibacter aquimixticola]|uniref:hypothetical protein n=1 Tax=Aurantiacibacter aquimixticola TaxID=1958945 RepID=UPI001058CA4B|nr:hypothetical protein [Aurantiacibacter aquimixticola]